MNPETILTALNQYFDDPGVLSQEQMAHGRENTSIKLVLASGEHLIMRVWGEEHSHIGRRKLSDITGELAFMMRCHDADLAVPKVYLSKQGQPYAQLETGEYFMLMDFVPGVSPRDFSHHMVTQVAETMARMHLLAQDFAFPEPRSWLGTVVQMTEADITKYSQNPVVDEPQREYLMRMREACRAQLQDVDLAVLPAGPIHGDIFWENMKFEGEELSGIFDFDDCRTSYFLEDILKTLLYDFDDAEHGFYGQDGSNIEVFMRAYQAIRPLTEGELQALPGLFTVSYVYRLASYIRRSLNGKAEYEARIPNLMKAYEDRKDSFLELAGL